MPLVRVELFERRLTPELESKPDRPADRDADRRARGPELTDHTWVIVEGHDAHRWGRDGKPWDEALSRYRAASTSASSTGGAPATTAAASRACSSVVRTISFARA